jgi:hypothetical protein
LGFAVGVNPDSVSQTALTYDGAGGGTSQTKMSDFFATPSSILDSMSGGGLPFTASLQFTSVGSLFNSRIRGVYAHSTWTKTSNGTLFTLTKANSYQAYVVDNFVGSGNAQLQCVWNDGFNPPATISYDFYVLGE